MKAIRHEDEFKAFDRRVAIVLDPTGRQMGYLRLERVDWISGGGLKSFFNLNQHQKPALEWMIVWDRSVPDFGKYSHGVEASADFTSELKSDRFRFRGVDYKLQWLESIDAARIVSEVFGANSPTREL
jgi:hypothetical protein